MENVYTFRIGKRDQDGGLMIIFFRNGAPMHCWRVDDDETTARKNAERAICHYGASKKSLSVETSVAS